MATIDQYKIQIDVEGTSNVKNLDTAMKDADKTATKLQKTADDTGKALDKLGQRADTVAKVTGGAFALLIASAVRYADQISDVADATGMSVGFVGALSDALGEAGGKFDDVGKVVTTFYQNLDELGNLNVKTAKAFEQLGITFDDLATKTPTEIFSRALTLLAQMDEGAQRTALGIQIFGKAFREVDPKKLKEALDSKDINKLAVELQNAGDAADSVAYNFRMLQKAALDMLSPIIGETKNMRLNLEQAKTLLYGLGTVFAVAFGTKTILNVIALTKEIKTLVTFLSRNPVVLGLTALAAGVGLVADKLGAFDKLKGMGKDVGKVDTSDAEAEGAIAKQMAEAKKEAADQQQRSNNLLAKQNGYALEYQRIINGTVGQLDEQAKRTKLIADIDKETKNKIAEIDKQINEERAKGIVSNELLIAQLEKQKSLVTKQADQMKILKQVELTNLEAQIARKDYINQQNELLKLQMDNAMELLRADQMRQVIAGEISEQDMSRTLEVAKIQIESAKRVADLRRDLENATSQLEKNRIMESISLENQRAQAAIDAKNREITEKTALEQSYNAGVIRGLEQIAEQFKPINMAQKAVNDTWGTISNSVDTFVNTGKFKFSDFARSIVADLAKMIAKALIFRAISGFLGSVGIPLPGLAEGGPAEKGKPYMVGERGPELFVPKSAGTVIPNDKLAAAPMSAPQQQPVVNNYNYNNNINAVDAKSVATLFYENRKALFGATNQARRELPYGAAA